MEHALEIIANAGLPGAFLIVMGWVCWQQYKQIEQLNKTLVDAQQSRVNDAQKVAENALEREEKWQTTLTNLTMAIERMLDRQSERERERRSGT